MVRHGMAWRHSKIAAISAQQQGVSPFSQQFHHRHCSQQGASVVECEGLQWLPYSLTRPPHPLQG